MRTIVLLSLLAAACSASPNEWTKRFAVSGKPELRVDTNDAAVRVRAVPGAAIEARVTTSGWRIGPDEVRVIDHQMGNHVDIDVRIPHLHLSFGHRWVRIEITVPPETATVIRTGDGSVTLEGTLGDAQVSTGDGSITVDNLEGALQARTGDGRIVARGRFSGLTLHTGDGSIEAEVRSGSRATAPWRIDTGDGSVHLRLPSDLAADLDVHTGDGGIHSELPLTVSGSPGRNDLRGKLHGGGATVTIRTGDGSVHLGRM